MRKSPKIFFGIIFTLAVLFCFGIIDNSHSNIQLFSIALSVGSNSDGNSFRTDIDSFDDDQNSPVIESSSVTESISQLPIPRKFFLINKFSLSVWQPPKIS